VLDSYLLGDDGKLKPEEAARSPEVPTPPPAARKAG
jgi:hypothetical protein